MFKKASLGCQPIDGRLSVTVRLAAMVLALAIVVYVGAVTIYDLPPSPARQAMLPAVNQIVQPWFDQQWTLFAPTVPVANARLYLLVRYKTPSGLRQAKPVDLSAVFQRIAQAQRWAPPRLYRVTMSLAVEIDQVVLYASRQPTSPGGDQSATAQQAQAEANAYFAPTALGSTAPLTPVQSRLMGLEVTVELQRLLSASAHDLLPESSRIASVRGVETSQAIPPFSHPHLHEVQRPVFDTGWLPYQKDVAS